MSRKFTAIVCALAVAAAGASPATALNNLTMYQRFINRLGDTMPGNLLFAGPSQNIDLTYGAVRQFNASAIAGQGNAFSYCSIDGCAYLDGPQAGLAASIDHQRATALFSSITSDDGHSQENTLGLETTIQTGWKTGWAAGTSYAAGANVISGDTIYRANAACTSGSTAPTGYGAAVSDGGCSWNYINVGSLDAKVGFYNACRVKQGAGPAWCSAENMVIDSGPQQPGVTQKELDITNLGPKADIGTPIIFGLNIGLGGNTITTGLQVGAAGSSTSNPGSLFGAWFTGGSLAKISTIEVDTPSARSILIGGLNPITNTSATIEDRSLGPFSYLVSGNHSNSTFFDSSTSPASLQIGGTHTVADINLISTNSPTGIFLQGAYTAYQIYGKGFNFDTQGNLNFTGTGAPALNFSQTAGAPGSASKIGLFGTAYGLGVSANSLDYVAPSGAAHTFYGGNVVSKVGFQEVLTTPASSSATCTAGQFTDDANYHYVCVATNSWKRAALSAF